MQQATKQKRAIRKKRRQLTDIPRTVKLTVWARDNGQCIYCKGRRPEYLEPIVNGKRKMASAFYTPSPNAHFIPRSKGGLGVEENIVTLCQLCHHDFDNGKDAERKKDIGKFIENYLKNYYGPEWNVEKLIYSRFKKEGNDEK
jgi:5-methylcytosine-specific restriction endonuclease McrA